MLFMKSLKVYAAGSGIECGTCFVTRQYTAANRLSALRNWRNTPEKRRGSSGKFTKL